MKFQFLLERKFRAGGLYRLIEWSHLESHQKEALAGLQDESEVFGVFEPVTRSENLASKVAYREIALLYFHLQHNSNLPHYLIFSGDQKINETIAALLLDGIIEIEWQGKFVSGPGALPVIYDSSGSDEPLPTYLSQLSFKAIHYAWMLDSADERSIVSRLYTFNTVPWDASMKKALHDKHSVKDFLFSFVDDNTMNGLNDEWNAKVTEKKEWISWNRKVIRNLKDVQPSRIYKLYISPLINDLPLVLSRFVSVVNGSNAVSFKIGNTIQGLLRPDKMVVYFYSKESLFETAAKLKESLTGHPAQGVPFSSQLDDNGLLSWGEDPADEGRPDPESRSWRMMISDTLAAILLQAKESGLSWAQATSYMEAMMKTRGIDTRHWEPTGQFNN